MKSILDIALECGFTNIRTFNRVFKQVKQRTPSELR
ncbi:helix-turn-helix domain-containing protein [Paenibacillus rhizoplanae]